MPRYRNENTGQVVDYPRPDARLEFLPNWNRLDADVPEPSGSEPGQPGDVPEQPSQREPKAAWVAYANRVDPGGGDHSGMTKAELVETYGG